MQPYGCLLQEKITSKVQPSITTMTKQTRQSTTQAETNKAIFLGGKTNS